MKFSGEIKDKVLILTLEGDLIGQDSGLTLMDKLNDYVNDGIQYAVINMPAVRYMNSNGLGVLMTILTKFRNIGGDVVLVEPSENVQKLLIITKLNSIFVIEPDVEKAVAYLKSL
ncbi:MAG: STAS domain-containing protein [Cytophagales bacterium]|nr:STAS domain-containing protein [Cytophagales bacterium]